MGIINKINEHLKTKKKYNTLLLKYEIVKEDLEKAQIDLSIERNIHKKQKELWEKKLKELQEEIIKLKGRKKNDSNHKKRNNNHDKKLQA